jgi:anaerobic selenocysteine-containing dehydrogenase
MVQTAKTYCRNCLAFCGLEVDVEDNKVVAVRGDRADPLSGGYTCVRGRALPEMMNNPRRLRRSMKRMPDGSFVPIEVERAMDEIAEKLAAIKQRDGADAIGLWKGNSHATTALTKPLSEAWLAGLGSSSVSSPVTIDQPAKKIVPHVHGNWQGGMQPFWNSDVWMVLGTNALISHTPGYDSGMPGHNPSKFLNDGKRRGLKLIVVDPRLTETARRADIFLQIKPGEDATLLAAMIRIIIDEKLYDADFCATYTEGLERLRQAVEPFTLDYAAARTDLAAADIEAAARLFGKGPRGCATTGTGIDMSRHPTLTEHLVACLNSLGGRYNRAGDPVNNPGVLLPARVWRAQVAPPTRPWLKQPRNRVRGLPMFFGEITATSLPDEILLPGRQQIKALISVAGNPAVSIPDQEKTVTALKSLELLVTVDPWMTQTARLSHYVIAPTLPLERPDHCASFIDARFPVPFSRYTEAVVQPDEALIDDWAFFWGLAHRMRTPLPMAVRQGWFNSGIAGGKENLDLDRKPTTEELLVRAVEGSRIPLDEVKKHPSGHIFENKAIVVQPGDPKAGKLNFIPDDLFAELAEVQRKAVVAGAGYEPGQHFTHRLVNSRMNEMFNSVGTLLPELKGKRSTNPAYMNPSDMAALKLTSGTLIEIASSRARIRAVAQESQEIKSGVIAIAQCWGTLPGEDELFDELGANTNRLVEAERDFCTVSGMPLMTSIPVNVRALAPAP